MTMKNILFCLMLLSTAFGAQSQQTTFRWPNGKKTAISLTFDDARASQVLKGIQVLDRYNVKATFFVNPDAVSQQLQGWKLAVQHGHEIGNHSLNHPCTGNFLWSRQKALENYDLVTMRAELMDANTDIEKLLGVRPNVFAYPCGQTFVGRGKDTKSYVPLVAELFQLGRLWLSEGPNDPTFCDFAQLTGVEMDGKDFDAVLPLIESASRDGSWLVLAGHEMGDSGAQTTRLQMIQKLIEYAQDPSHGIWIAPAGEVARYVATMRK